jgi:hypothetical protein
VSTSVTSGDGPDVAERMGIESQMIVMEIGWDEDCDEQLRDVIAERVGEDGLVDEDSDEVVDVALLWFRESDGDLADALVDAIAPLADSGWIWLLTPKRGRDGYVEPSEIAEAAAIAGLSQTTIATVGEGWTAARLVGRRSAAKK